MTGNTDPIWLEPEESTFKENKGQETVLRDVERPEEHEEWSGPEDPTPCNHLPKGLEVKETFPKPPFENHKIKLKGGWCMRDNRL